MTNKQKYHSFCKTEPSIPMFSKDWWLDAVCGGDNWDVVLIEKGEWIIACLPYLYIKRHLFTILGMPQLTQTLGPWMRSSKAKYTGQLIQQKNLMTSLIDNLPVFDSFSQNFHYSITNWLPFYWRGFQQTTFYTYILDDLSNTNKLRDNFKENIRRELKKAKNRFGLQIRTDLGIDAFLAVNELTFARQDMRLPYTRDFVLRLDNACESHNARKIFFAQDKDGKIHAATYIIWDENSAYYLMGGSDPELRNSGANSLCMWEAIKFASTVTQKFDFEGSMIKPVERFFRAFGARQVPYFHITKTNSKLLRLRKIASSLFKR